MHFTNGMVPLMSPVPTVVTIHDMSLRLYPRYHPPRRVLLNRPLVDLAARRADAIITVSESAKRDIVRLYSLRSAPRARRARGGGAVVQARARSGRARARAAPLRPRRAHHPLRRHDRAAQEPADADRRVRARRRRSGELHASARVRRPLRLAVARHRGAHRPLERRARDQLHRLRAVRGSARRSTASPRCSCIPSMYEGFGLPVIEAMACGAPVITGRAAALAEVGGGAIEHVDRDRADALGQALVALAAQPRSPRGAVGRRARAVRGVLVGARRAREPRDLSADGARPQARGAPRPPIARSASARASATPRESRRAASTTDVLFGQAYFLRFDPKLWEARQPYAPLGALYAAACVRERRLPRRAVRRDAGGVRARMGGRARRAPPALRRDLRGQLQLPEQDVPAAHARRRR